MISNEVSRRGFLSTAVGVGATGAIPAQEPVPQFPEQAWIIVEQHWEHNDEFYMAGGECAHLELFYSKAQAEVECRRLNEEFFAMEPPEDYWDEMECYLESGTYDPAEVTWDELRAAGYRGPYRVQVLNTPTRKPPP